jgi:hypothetical protein
VNAGAERISISFSGAFYAWPYHAGVAAYVRDNSVLGPGSRIYGTSSGAVAGVLLACGVDIEAVGLDAGFASNDEHVAGHRTPFFHPRKVQRSYIETFAPVLPTDAHRHAHNKLFLSVKVLPLLRKRIISEYPTRDALIDVISATIAVPGHSVHFAHRTRTAKLGWCIDGGAEPTQDNRPGWRRVRVSVWGGKRYDITPSRAIPMSMRFGVQDRWRRLDLFELGYQDAESYFNRSLLQAHTG